MKSMVAIEPAPIAFGRTAEIYPWPEGKILKLYYNWCPANWVEMEISTRITF